MLLSGLQLIIIGICAVVLVGVHGLLKYTRLGKAMRATSANKNLARNSGIKTQFIISTTWLISGALCGLAGTVFAMNAGVFEATSAQLYIVLLLAAMFLGGPGEPYGAMFGAITIGLATEISAAYINPDYKEVIAFVVLIAMLMFRPFGIFGSEKTN
jgi:branched-chain amino acid transport system permease protein/neutral amino acid transport system permease protein